MTSQAVITHPELGPLTIVTFLALDESACALAAYTPAGELVWSQASSGHMTRYELAGPAQDATGNVFVLYNPAKYDGVEILQPWPGQVFINRSMNYWENVESGTRSSENTMFYNAELQGPQANGEYTVIKYTNSCNPSCAQGATTAQTFVWNPARPGYNFVP